MIYLSECIDKLTVMLFFITICDHFYQKYFLNVYKYICKLKLIKKSLTNNKLAKIKLLKVL